MSDYKATCGHVDLLGYFAGTCCGKCARDGHRRALGNTSKPKRRRTK